MLSCQTTVLMCATGCVSTLTKTVNVTRLMAVNYHILGKKGHEDINIIPVTAGPAKDLRNPCEEYVPSDAGRAESITWQEKLCCCWPNETRI